MTQYFWDTAKPIMITLSAGIYAFFNTSVLVFIQSISPAEMYPGFNLVMYFIIKITGAVSGVFGAVYIIYRLAVLHRDHKKDK